jgi:REP element-mobilizing transposase RayT
MSDERFKNKYRIRSARLPGWDYSSSAHYFIIICTKDKIHQFGKIKNGVMCLYKTGSIAWEYWLEIPSHFHHIYVDEFVVMPNHIHGIIRIDHGDALGFDTCVECKQWYVERRRGRVHEINNRFGLNNGIANTPVEMGQCPISTFESKNIVLPTKMDITKNDFDNTKLYNVGGFEQGFGLNHDVVLQTGDETGQRPVSTGVITVGDVIGSYKSIVTKTINNMYIQHNITQKFAWQERFYDSIARNEFGLQRIREYIWNNPAKWSRDRNNIF